MVWFTGDHHWRPAFIGESISMIITQQLYFFPKNLTTELLHMAQRYVPIKHGRAQTTCSSKRNWFVKYVLFNMEYYTAIIKLEVDLLHRPGKIYFFTHKKNVLKIVCLMLSQIIKVKIQCVCVFIHIYIYNAQKKM